MRAKITGLLIALIFLAGGANAGELIVCKGCTDPNFSSIQAAIDKAADDDVIIVQEGSYQENVIIYKRLTVIGLNQPVVDANFNGSAFTLTADNVTLSGFRAINSGTEMEDAGIKLRSNGNSVNANTAFNNSNGIYIFSSSWNNVTNNIAFNNSNGIYIFSSSWNNVTNNIVLNNSNGIYIFSSNWNNVTNNAAISNQFGFYLHDSDQNYLEGNAADSNNIGVYLDTSVSNTISASSISNNSEGAYVVGSNENYIYNNNNSNNVDAGFLLESSSSNYIYNNLFNNTINAYDDNINFWNTTKGEGKNIIGGPFMGGNYWSDYNGVDNDGDGIGDIPQNIPGVGIGMDYLPLTPYVSPGTGGEGFDTGEGGYPSISGVHNGTITLNKTLILHRLYTYPSTGTGGHSEYVKIYNNSWSIEANWSGYTGDWHNITFSQSFTLEAGVTYNYTIRTGSYPQIIHRQNHTTPDGSIITSTEFIDANGRHYSDWIPAIRLE